jgi:hypothetical protein
MEEDEAERVPSAVGSITQPSVHNPRLYVWATGYRERRSGNGVAGGRLTQGWWRCRPWPRTHV